MEKVTLPLNLINTIMGYLGKQPYEQVFQFFAEVQKEAQVQTPPPQDKPND